MDNLLSDLKYFGLTTLPVIVVILIILGLVVLAVYLKGPTKEEPCESYRNTYIQYVPARCAEYWKIR